MSKFIAKLLIIVILVLVIIYVVHTLKVKRTPGNGGRLQIKETYVITLGHNCFKLNNVEKRSLLLKRGEVYEFKNETDEPIYFTTSNKGGEGGPGSLAKNVPLGSPGLFNGIIYFKVTDDLPKTFYYQSDKHEFYGGSITVKD